MPQSLHQQLLSQARRLARLDQKGRPKQGNLRRGVSAAYYGLFHFLLDRGARTMMGTANDRRPYRDVLARSFDHSVMKRACSSFAGGSLRDSIRRTLHPGWQVPPGVRQIARTFVEAQEQRHLADYDRSARFTRAEVFSLIQKVDQAITAFGTISTPPETQFFLCCLLVWDRLERRG